MKDDARLLIALFCNIDDFCRQVVPQWHHRQLSTGEHQRHRATRLTMSEMMTTLVHFPQSHYRDFKADYLQPVSRHLQNAFPGLLSDSRFIALVPFLLRPLVGYFQQRKGTASGLAFLDSTALIVGHNRRLPSSKVFKQLARRGKTSMGWFYGFKLHRVVNDGGELLAFRLTPGHVDDRKPVLRLPRGLTGNLFGDRGPISHALFEALLAEGLQLITRWRTGMTYHLLRLMDQILRRKRALIECHH